jgi:hypothetical protein
MTALNSEPLSADAFSTYKLFGGRVHREIIETALTPCGLTKKSISRIVAACDAQDDPTGANFTRSECHATDNQVALTFTYIKSKLSEAAAQANGCQRSSAARTRSLKSLGEAFHALQDFYSHSNYLEYLLAAKKSLDPIDWEQPRAEITTCHYYYAGFFKQEAFETRDGAVAALKRQYPGRLKFHTDQEFGIRSLVNCPEETVLGYALAPVSFTHIELNKDNDRTLEGSVISGQYGKTYHHLARQLAEKDTARAWRMFERSLHYRYGDKADSMLLALKLSEDERRKVDEDDD